jgi:alpha-galactosidase
MRRTGDCVSEAEQPVKNAGSVTNVMKNLASVEPWDQGEPRMHGPAVYGCGVRTPFAYAVPACGKRPLTFAAEGLPPGLEIDAVSGVIRGSVRKAGSWDCLLTVVNAEGRARRELRITSGSGLCLTPPMGWLSWYCWGSRNFDHAKTVAAAEALVSTGLAAYGFNFVVVDDGWQGERGGPLNALQPNEHFPDMQGLVEHIHRLGLKAGIYSTPWTQSYGGFRGSTSGAKLRGVSRSADERPGRWIGDISHIRTDARQFAAWGFDSLKYDWDHWGVAEVEEVVAALKETGRDMALSLSNKAPFDLAADWARLANFWRTTGDADGTWPRTSFIGFDQDKWTPFASPGHWNDLDCLMVDVVNWGNPANPKEMTADEQLSHVTLWSLLASPLLLGCDVTRLKPLTLRLLCNPEVLAVDQDALGRQGHTVREVRATDVNGRVTRHEHVMARKLVDGSQAIGLFNRADCASVVTVTWEDLQLKGSRRVRDLWAQRDLGREAGSLSFRLAPHGCRLVKLSK